MPHVLRRRGAIARAVIGEEGVAGVTVHAELVRLAVLVKLLLHTRRMGRRRVRVFLPEEPEQRAGQRGNHINRRHRALWRVLLLENKAPGGIGGRIYVGALAAHDERVPPARAKADGADLAIRVGHALDMYNRPVQVSHGLRVRHREHRLYDAVHIARIGRALARVHIGRHGDIPLLGKAPRHVFDVIVQPESFHNHHDARVAACSRRAAEIGVDLGAVLTRVLHHARLDLWWVHKVLLVPWVQRESCQQAIPSTAACQPWVDTGQGHAALAAPPFAKGRRSIEFISLSFWYAAPLISRIVTGGTTYGWFTVYRATVSPDGVPERKRDK